MGVAADKSASLDAVAADAVPFDDPAEVASLLGAEAADASSLDAAVVDTAVLDAAVDVTSLDDVSFDASTADAGSDSTELKPSPSDGFLDSSSQ